jgi:folate-binding protein YgfZ
LDWLQGLITNDVLLVSQTRSIYSALLSPQGKILFDFFIIADGDNFLLDCEKERRDELMKRLHMYRLRSVVEIEVVPDLQVAALYSERAMEGAGLLMDSAGTTKEGYGGTVFVDPRCAALGARLVARAEPLADAMEEAMISLTGEAYYNERRLALGVPDGSLDLVPDKAFALESNLEELAGVSFSKGCFIGQEVTARTKHKATLRKRILPVHGSSPLPQSGTVISADRSEIGTLLSGQDKQALALVRLDRWQAAIEKDVEVKADDIPLEIEVPPWLNLKEA